MLIHPVTVHAQDHHKILSRASFEVISAESADDGIRLIKSRKPDLVLIDIALPGSTEAVRKLRGFSPDTPFIVITKSSSLVRLLECLGAGASGFLVKPILRNTLLRAVDDAFNGRIFVSKEAATQILFSIRNLALVPFTPGFLSPREAEIMVLLFRGASDKEIGVNLNTSSGSLRTHIDRLFKKLDVSCRSDAVQKYFTVWHDLHSNRSENREHCKGKRPAPFSSVDANSQKHLGTRLRS